MDSIIEDLIYVKNDCPPANQQGLPQYYREQLLVLHDVIRRLMRIEYSIESNLMELESLNNP
jgi:hypothetical protein